MTWDGEPGGQCLRVHGARAADVERLSIVPTEVRELDGLQPTAGRFDIIGEHDLRFTPRFPFVPGTCYSLLLDGCEVASATLPAAQTAPVTSVMAIYPSAGQIPFNLLKIYVTFSNPMSEGWADRAIQVRQADTGRPLPGVFLPMQPELWDRARTRLTVLLDPGRIKRGLAPNEEMGYPLVENTPVVVATDVSFHDAEGRRLVAGAEQRYAVGPAVRARVDPKRWTLAAARAFSRDALMVRFDRPLDRAMLEHSLDVVNADGRLVAGSATVGEAERSWSFTPRDRWTPGQYHLRVDARLEDLAGNSLTRVFDRDLTLIQDNPLAIESAVLEFPVR